MASSIPENQDQLVDEDVDEPVLQEEKGEDILFRAECAKILCKCIDDQIELNKSLAALQESIGKL